MGKTQSWFLVGLLKEYKTMPLNRKSGLNMRRSKLEVQVDILKAVRHHGPLRLTHIMYKANANCNVLKQYLGLLEKHSLVERQTLHGKGVVYAITDKGKAVLKYFQEVNEALQITATVHNTPPALY